MMITAVSGNMAAKVYVTADRNADASIAILLFRTLKFYNYLLTATSIISYAVQFEDS